MLKNSLGKQENVSYKNSPMKPLQKTKQNQKPLSADLEIVEAAKYEKKK